jgi:coproporphyrinogen III oxidase
MTSPCRSPGDLASAQAQGDGMTDWTTQTARARAWFESLRDRICAEFEAIEREAGSDAAFSYRPWNREHDGEPVENGGGGVQGLMKGKVFEKVGVNVSTVHGAFSPEFARTINGADPENPVFTATGISLVAHMANPHVPAVHMNTRFLTTSKAWFGGGGDLNPPLPYEADTADFHARFKQACDAHDPAYHPRFKKWADDYFYIPHRTVHRGVGGIFYDHLECADEAAFDENFAFTRDVGEAFLDVYPRLVRRRMTQEFTAADELQMLEWRGRYAEFNLVHDRGTLFGLKTGGNIDAILMSLPPRAVWS